MISKTTFDAAFENLDEIRELVGRAAGQIGFSDKEVYAIQLAADEASSNIIEHAYAGVTGGKIEIELNISERELKITMRDYGKSFDPSSVPEPNVKADLSERKIGGLGMYLMRKLMDRVEQLDELNVVALGPRVLLALDDGVDRAAGAPSVLCLVIREQDLHFRHRQSGQHRSVLTGQLALRYEPVLVLDQEPVLAVGAAHERKRALHLLAAQKEAQFAGGQALTHAALGFGAVVKRASPAFLRRVDAAIPHDHLARAVLALLVGGIFLIEALSVMIQVFTFKYLGRRVFLMTPIHHHFEMKAWSETKIMVRFWIFTAILCACGFALYYRYYFRFFRG